jgi:hypothetical protein
MDVREKLVILYAHRSMDINIGNLFAQFHVRNLFFCVYGDNE